MSRSVLVTGATGALGHRVVPEATEAGHEVRALSRRERVGYTGVHWYRGDLLKNVGLDAALDGVNVVVHCATQFIGRKDLVGTENLIAAARRAGVGHLVYMSIVGIDDIALPYYKTKLAVERAVAASGLGYTVLRATQFHNLIEATFAAQRFSPVLWALRDVRFQPIDVRDVAGRLVELVGAGPSGRVPDIGGPAVVDHSELGRMYLAARRRRRRVVSFTFPGNIVAGYKSGANLAPENAFGALTFQDYLSLAA